MGLLTLEQLLECRPFRSERVEVPELGGDVLIREFGGSDRDRVVRFLYENKSDVAANLNNGEFMLLVLSLALCNEDGSRLFTDDKIHVLRRWSEKVVDRLYGIAARMNALGGESVDDAVKNSGSGQSFDSGTASPDTLAAQ